MNQSEEKLSAALRELAASSGQGASPELGLMLKNAFQRHHARRKRVLRVRLTLASLCLAALAASFVLRKSPTNSSGETPVVHKIPPQEVSYPADAIASKTKRPAPPTRLSSKRNAPTAARAFVALPSFDMLPPGDELRVVRLEMPGEDLGLVGAPVSEQLAGRRVTADFVVGHDGTPYAMRLVQSKF